MDKVLGESEYDRDTCFTPTVCLYCSKARIKSRFQTPSSWGNIRTNDRTKINKVCNGSEKRFEVARRNFKVLEKA
jgi:hypothetical protein